jgi:hypothetical protein
MIGERLGHGAACAIDLWDGLRARPACAAVPHRLLSPAGAGGAAAMRDHRAVTEGAPGLTRSLHGGRPAHGHRVAGTLPPSKLLLCKPSIPAFRD